MKKKRLVYEYTHREIADVLGVSVLKVQRIEKEALEKIAHYLSELEDFK